MAGNQFKGFCTSCMKNIPHVCMIHNPVIRLIDLMTLKAARLFRIGFWHCIQCGHTSYRLHPIRREAPTFQFDQSSKEKNVQPVGNYLKSEQSLVLRAKRAHRYSAKFRDSIVLRLIAGTSTMSQLGRELNVSEVDLMDWIADYIFRKDERIRELEILVQRMSRNERLLESDSALEKDGSETASPPPPVSYANEDALDVQVNPKRP